MSLKQPALYFGVLAMMVFVVGTALGGGFFGQEAYWMVQWQHQAFSTLCHQIPERSFWLGGQPMAVCSRCLGIYSGFLIGWLSLPLWALVNLKKPGTLKKYLFLAIGMNLLDILGNVLGFWQNTLLSRLILGWPIGLAAAVLFSGSFFIRKSTKKEVYYGRVSQ